MIYSMIILMSLTISQFNLYQTDKTLMMSAFEYDCLYYNQDYVSDASINVVRAYTVIKNVHFTRTLATTTVKISQWMIGIVF